MDDVDYDDVDISSPSELEEEEGEKEEEDVVKKTAKAMERIELGEKEDSEEMKEGQSKR